MHEDHNIPPDDIRLARAFNAAHAGDAVTPDANMLAAWIDGTLEPEEAAEVEAALAADELLRRFVSESMLGPRTSTESVKPELLERIRSIPLSGTAPHPFPTHARTNRSWRMASGAAAAIAIAFLGFWAGRLSVTNPLQTDSEFLATATFDVFTNDDSDPLDVAFPPLLTSLEENDE